MSIDENKLLEAMSDILSDWDKNHTNSKMERPLCLDAAYSTYTNQFIGTMGSIPADFNQSFHDIIGELISRNYIKEIETYESDTVSLRFPRGYYVFTRKGKQAYDNGTFNLLIANNGVTQIHVLPGTKVYDKNSNEYIVEDFLGNGSFGFVHRLRRLSDNSQWALKTISPIYDNEETKKSFFNEGNLALRIIHPNVIKYQYFHDGSVFKKLPPYIIMEYANNGNLSNIISNKLKSSIFFTNDELATMFRELIDGMKAINSVLVHRDIKPDNILRHDNSLKISDFGLAKIVLQQTRTSTFKGFGHIQYMAPEGWSLDKNTIQMDIYSMGLVFYQLATLRHAFSIVETGDIVGKWRGAHLYEIPANPQSINSALSIVLKNLIMRMIEKSTSDRCRDWDDVLFMLEKHQAPPSKHSSSIDHIVNKISSLNTAEQTARLKAEKEAEIEKDFKQLIQYQFNSTIINPLKEWCSDFNSRSTSGSINLNFDDSKNSHIMNIAGKARILFNISPVYKLKWRYERRQRDYDRMFDSVYEVEPKLNEKLILAWGYVKDNLNRGFNLFLLKKDDDIYGDWVMMFNKNNALSRELREPEPFAFEYDEFQKELPLVKHMHIYNSSILPFKLDTLIEFISRSI